MATNSNAISTASVSSLHGYVLAAVAACAHTPCRIAPYCPLGNTGFCRAIAPRVGGQYALLPGYVLAAVAACAHTPCRIAPYCPLGNTGFCRPIARWAIRAFVALLPVGQYGLLSRCRATRQ